MIKQIIWYDTMSLRKKFPVGIKEKDNETLTAHDDVKKLYLMYQRLMESNDDYFYILRKTLNTEVED